jgi:hypothetical protein
MRGPRTTPGAPNRTAPPTMAMNEEIVCSMSLLDDVVDQTDHDGTPESEYGGRSKVPRERET